MAREGREGQGLQIAVIIFAMLTIILAVTTYVFYAQGQTALKEKAAADAATAAKQQELDKEKYKVAAMKQALGLGGVGDAEVQFAKGKQGVGEDPEMTELLNNFKNDMALVADQVAATEARNYRTVSNILMNMVIKKNQSVTDANNSTRDVQTKSAAALTAADGRAKSFEEAATKEKTDKDTVLADFTAARTTMNDARATLEQQIAAQAKKAKDDADKASKALSDVTAVATTRANTLEALNVRLKELESGQVDLFENPDGRINWINQKQRLVWLNVGRSDGLMRQTTFSVYDHDENGVANAKSKGRIEVVEISGDHLAEARILEDSPANPILVGDIVHTPSWSPGQRIHFAMAGKMDINKDSLDDYEMVKNVIKLNGGEIDAELKPDGTRLGKLSVNTRYLVLGDRPDERDSGNANLLAQYTKIYDESKQYGIDIIPVQKLLSLMGWKSEERTVELAGSRGGGEFRKRAPGKTAPAAPGAGTPAPTTTPAPNTTPAPAGAVDPFAVPAATPAPAGTPAPPAADPFGAPAPAAPATPAPAPKAPAADPFGAPAP